MAAMSGRVNPTYTSDRKKADEELQSVLTEQVNQRNETPKLSWDRTPSNRNLTGTGTGGAGGGPSSGSNRAIGRSKEQDQEEKRRTLRDEAEAMRKRLAALDGKPTVNIKSDIAAMPTTTNVSLAASPTPRTNKKPSAYGTDDKAAATKHSLDTLKKKLAKVEKMIHKETAGSKEHKKLLKKKNEYQRDIDQLHQDTENDSESESAEEAAAAAAAEQRQKEKLREEARRLREEAEKAAAAKAEKDKTDAAARDAAKKLVDDNKRRDEEAREKETQRCRREAEEEKAEHERRLEQKRAAEREEQERHQRETAAAKAKEDRRAEEQHQNNNDDDYDDDMEEEWDVVRVIPTAEEKVVCRSEDCYEQAVVIWASSLDPSSEWPVCEDCQLSEFGGWPEGVFPIKRSDDTGDDSEEIARLLAEKEEEERRLKAVREQEEQRQREECEAQRLASEKAAAEAAKAQQQQQQQQEPSKEFLDRRAIPQPYSDNTKKILREIENMETRHKKLEKSLTQNGIPVMDDIPYEVAKDKMAEISQSMKDLAVAAMDPYKTEKQYFILEEQLAKYSTALMLTDEYQEEQKRIEQEWEAYIAAGNVVCLQKLRAHMPVAVRSLTEDELTSTPSPNGKILPKSFARKFKRTNVLQLIRVNPDDIEKMHPSLLEGMRTTGLTLTERRALHEHLRDVACRWEEKHSDPSCEKKWQWFQGLKLKFKEMMNAYTACVDKYGPPGSHQYAKQNDPSGGGCPLLGNQCPLKADAVMDYSEDYGFSQEAEYEPSASSGGPSRSASMRFSRRGTSTDALKSTKSKASETQVMEELRQSLGLDGHESEVDKKLLRELFHADKRTKMLEKQLTQAGLSLPQEDISFSVAKTRVAELTVELKTVAASMASTSDAKELAKLESDFGKLSEELDKYNNAMMLTKEWAKEQESKEREWEAAISPKNYAALQQVWRHIPVNIRDLSEADLTRQPTPNGQLLPKTMAKKFKRTNILMLLRMDPASIEPMHPSSLEAMRTTGLTLTERRAIHEHLKDIAPKWKLMSSDKMAERKWMWHASLKSKFKEMLENYEKHTAEFGPPENHPYAKRNEPGGGGGCPLLGNQCPLKADLAIDYSGDYGFPDSPQYGEQAVAKSNLLSMEDIERRRREDEMEFGGGSGHPISNTDVASDPNPSPLASRPAAGPPGGLLAAIKKAPAADQASVPAPALSSMGGLLAEISSKKSAFKSSGGGEMGGLLAEIQSKAPKEESPMTSPTADKAKKRGLLGRLTGRGKGE